MKNYTRITTYNVNGIRAALNKGLDQWLFDSGTDIICMQEIKAYPEQVNLKSFEEKGYYMYWHPAQKKGYSGVAIFSKIQPEHIEIGCGNPLYDSEGRVIRADYKSYSVISVYMPSGSSGDVRQHFKMQWLDFFYEYIQKLRQSIPNLIICGDYNICHKAIDIHDPKGNAQSSGFLPEERDWMEKFISNGMIDSFRFFNPKPHEYTWWSYRANARANNKGWRIDYCISTDAMKSKLMNAKIIPDAMHSDHCPMYVDVNR